MKTFIALAALMTSFAAQAADETTLSFMNDEIVYASWCDGDSILTQDTHGKVYSTANCGDQNLVCKEKSRPMRNGVVFYAVCAE